MGDSINKCDCQAINEELAEKVKSEMEDDGCFSSFLHFLK